VGRRIHYKYIALGLTETVSALLIISFGIVGLAKLQTINISSLNNNMNTLTSSFLAENFAERLETNTEQAKNYTSSYTLASFTDTPPVAATSRLCITSSCTPANLAVYDLNTWLHLVKNKLPSGKAKVTASGDTATGIIYTIELQWQYKTETKQYKLVTQL